MDLQITLDEDRDKKGDVNNERAIKEENPNGLLGDICRMWDDGEKSRVEKLLSEFKFVGFNGRGFVITQHDYSIADANSLFSELRRIFGDPQANNTGDAELRAEISRLHKIIENLEAEKISYEKSKAEALAGLDTLAAYIKRTVK